jgi:phosphoribosylanthranilate isomerase
LPLDWLAETDLPLPWWLAGGISAEWIPELMERVQPDGLDASSRLEVRPGWKDLSKVQALLNAVQTR